MSDDWTRAIRPGQTVALGDGCGVPISLLHRLSRLAAELSGIRLVLGWCPTSLPGLDPRAFFDVVTVLGGPSLRRAINDGTVRQLPVRMGALPALMRDVLRPDVLLTSVVRSPDGYRFASESGWLWSVVDGGANVVAVEVPGPRCVVGPSLPPDQLSIVGRQASGPARVRPDQPTPVQHRIAARVSALVPPGARLQYAPGAIGTAVVQALTRPVEIDTGVITDAVPDLDRRGLLIGTPIAAYAVGGDLLYEWLDGRPVLDRAEVTYDPGRLRGTTPIVAVNTALEIDRYGQTNVEAVDSSTIAWIGGQPDFMAAASASPCGLSVIAMPTVHRGRRTLVDHLSTAVSTPSHDVDLVATETGVVDLRGLSRTERRNALTELWAAEDNGADPDSERHCVQAMPVATESSDLSAT